MVRRLPQLALVMLLATSASASAQRRPPKPPDTPQSLPPDLGFGWVGAPEHPLPIYPEGATLAELRDALDPLASQGVLLPSAHVPARGTLSARNHNLFGQQLGGVPWDDLMLSAMIFTPYAWLTDAPGLDLIAGAQLSWAASRTARGGLTLSAGYLTRSGGAQADSSEAGPMLGLVWERAVTPTLLLGLGALAYTPAWYSLEALDTSQCADREALLGGDCLSLTREVQRWPAGPVPALPAEQFRLLPAAHQLHIRAGQVVGHLRVVDHHPARPHRAEGQLRRPGHAQLAYDQYVQGSAQPFGDHRGHRDATADQAQHGHVRPALVRQEVASERLTSSRAVRIGPPHLSSVRRRRVVVSLRRLTDHPQPSYLVK